MKYPNEINSNFFKKMIHSGWFEEREIISDMPYHIQKLPENVKKFLKEIWFMTIVDDFYYRDEYFDIHSIFITYTFGETTKKLADYSDKRDEYVAEYSNLIGFEVRNFGFKDGRELLIDEKGRIYTIPDSGDLFFVGASFYEGLYNLIYDNTKSYLVLDKFKLAKIEDNNIVHTNFTLNDF